MLVSTFVHPKDYQFEMSPEMIYFISGTAQFPYWYKYTSPVKKIGVNEKQNEVISATFGKYAHEKISLTQSLLDERKAENDRQTKKFP